MIENANVGEPDPAETSWRMAQAEADLSVAVNDLLAAHERGDRDAAREAFSRYSAAAAALRAITGPPPSVTAEMVDAFMRQEEAIRAAPAEFDPDEALARGRAVLDDDSTDDAMGL